MCIRQIWCGKTLAFVDINKKRVYEHDARKGGAKGATQSVDVGKLVGCVVPRASGGLLACLEDSIVPVVRISARVELAVRRSGHGIITMHTQNAASKAT